MDKLKEERKELTQELDETETLGQEVLSFDRAWFGQWISNMLFWIFLLDYNNFLFLVDS